MVFQDVTVYVLCSPTRIMRIPGHPVNIANVRGTLRFNSDASQKGSVYQKTRRCIVPPRVFYNDILHVLFLCLRSCRLAYSVAVRHIYRNIARSHLVREARQRDVGDD